MFFIAIMFPAIMAVDMDTFVNDAPIAISVIITFSGAINGVFQLIAGFTNHYIGEAWGYRSSVLYAIIVLVLLYALSTKVKYQNILILVGMYIFCLYSSM